MGTEHVNNCTENWKPPTDRNHFAEPKNYLPIAFCGRPFSTTSSISGTLDITVHTNGMPRGWRSTDGGCPVTDGGCCSAGALRTGARYIVVLGMMGSAIMSDCCQDRACLSIGHDDGPQEGKAHKTCTGVGGLRYAAMPVSLCTGTCRRRKDLMDHSSHA